MKLRSYTKMDNLEQISQGEEYKIQVKVQEDEKTKESK